MHPLIIKIKKLCEEELAEDKANPRENLTDGTGRLMEGRFEMAETIIEIINTDLNKPNEDSPPPICYNITIPVSGKESDELTRGEEYSWIFNTLEHDGVIVRARLVNEEKYQAGDYE